MEQPKWPKLSHTSPADLNEHIASLGNDFKAVQDFLKAGVSDVAPSLPTGIKRKIRKGITKGLVEVESRNHSTSSISGDFRDLISSATLEAITVETAAAFHNRVPQYLFKILRDSYDGLARKLVAQQNDVLQQGAGLTGAAVGIEHLPQTPPDSPPENTDSELESIYYGSDTEGLACCDHNNTMTRLRVRTKKLNVQLQEVDQGSKVGNQRLAQKASEIYTEMQKVKLEEEAADKEHTEVLAAMEKRRKEQDRTGDYGSASVGYNVKQDEDFYDAKRLGVARLVTLQIQRQAAVNRLFNMTGEVLMRKVKEPVLQKSEVVEGRYFPTIDFFNGAELLDDGNVALWANCAEEYDCGNAEGDAFDGLAKMPFWDQDIFASFASHITEPYKTYPVEVKGIFVDDMVGLHDRKKKAEVITKFVQENITAIPSLHIDIVKDVRFSRRTTNDDSQALVLDFSDRTTANEVIGCGLWLIGYHPCQIFDPKFLDRCGYCQAYGHHATDCSGPPRCAKCSEPHRTKFCRSLYERCALCDEPHRCGSWRCRAKRARVLDKFNARFPVEKHNPLPAVPPAKPEEPSPSSRSPTPVLPAPPEEQVSTTKEHDNDPESTPVLTTPPDTPTLLARQLHATLPAIEAALWSDVSNMTRGRGLTPPGIGATSEPDEPNHKKERLNASRDIDNV